MNLTRLAICLALTVLPVGCVSTNPLPSYGKTREVEEMYRPLRIMSERPNMVLSDTAITTVGETVYVADLDKWMVDHPADSPRYHASLVHEQRHAERQIKTGVLKWVGLYLYDPAFMWAEEQIGWYHQLILLKNAGLQINVDGVANTLHGYKTLTGKRMVEVEEAKKWVNAVLSGQWLPPQ